MPRNGLPVDPETRARVLELFAAGELGRNAIAREVGLSGPTITGIAREVGHEFDRSQSELAVRARSIDLALIRQDLAKAAAVEAWQALEDMHAPALMVQWASATEHQDGGFQEHVLPEPTISDRRNLATVFGIMVTKIAELSRANDTTGADGIAFIDGLDVVLQRVRGLIEADPGTDPTVEPEPTTREAMLAELEAVAAQPDEDAP